MISGNVLVIDDEENMRSLLKKTIFLEGYTVYEAENYSSAVRSINKNDINVVVCDVKLPDGTGLEFTRYIRDHHKHTEVILLTAYANIADVVEAMRFGAFDYIRKGEDNDKLLPLIARAMEKTHLQRQVSQFENQVAHIFSFENIIGESQVLKETITMAKKITHSDTTVLILGETGTGKDLFARAIHSNGPRAGHPFIALNCSSFSSELLESELFGYTAGAFTGAGNDKKGLMEEANGGTLFLDEIGEMPVGIQAKLLRVLESRQFFKLGSTIPTEVDLRIISATNRNLQEDIRAGKFREDLFYRLNVFTIPIPALRHRKKDIPLLANYFTSIFARKMNKKIKGIDKVFISLLEQSKWKGNIRELKNVIERAVILEDGPILTAGNLPASLQPLSNPTPALTSLDLDTIEKLHIQRILDHTKGNKIEAAKLLKIGLTTIYRKIEKYKLG